MGTICPMLIAPPWQAWVLPPATLTGAVDPPELELPDDAAPPPPLTEEPPELDTVVPPAGAAAAGAPPAPGVATGALPWSTAAPGAVVTGPPERAACTWPWSW